MLQRFENTTIALRNQNAFANREQLQELYNVPKKTLADNINKLKSDGLVIGRKTAQWSIDGKRNYEIEVFNLDEIIAIGMRLRSDNAIKFQRWAIQVIKNELIQAREKLDEQQAQLDYFWDKSDQSDLYPKY